MTGCQECLWKLWKTVLPFSKRLSVGAFFRVHSRGSFRRQGRTRVTKVTDDIGRFDDESR